MNRKPLLILLNAAPLLLFAAVFALFGLLSGKFLTPQNLLNILIQSSALTIVAVGMTFVLLTAGIDLSVGAVMFVAVAVAGKLLLGEYPLWMAGAAALGVGLAAGTVNGVLVTRLSIAPFIVTLSLLFIGRGFGLWLTETRAMNMPDVVTQLGAARWLAIPAPVWLAGLVCLAAHLLLMHTPLGRQVYAVGFDREAARKAGVPVTRVLLFVYGVCGGCAALSGLVSLSQTGAVSPTFGTQKEFTAIAAAVLGGTSLFGGRGRVLPGTLLGAVLIQTIDNGLVILNADPYSYPLVTSAVIFIAVLLDSLRARLLARVTRRTIRVESSEPIRASAH